MSDVIDYIVVKTGNTTTKVPIGVNAENISGDISATKIGKATIGSVTKPIYLEEGVPTECTTISDTIYDVVTEETNGLMSTDMFKKFEALENYDLPTASSDTKGGIKIGNYLKVEDDVLSGNYQEASISVSGLMSSSDKIKLDTLENYELKAASADNLGGIKVGSNLVIDNGILSGDYKEATESLSGLMSNTDKTKLDNLENYDLPTASTDTKGGIKIGTGLIIEEEICSVQEASDTQSGILSSTLFAKLNNLSITDNYEETSTDFNYVASPIAVQNAYNNLLEKIPTPTGVVFPYVSVGSLAGCEYETLSEALEKDTTSKPIIIFSDITENSTLTIENRTVIGIKNIRINCLSGEDTIIKNSVYLENITFPYSPVVFENTSTAISYFKNCSFTSNSNDALVSSEITLSNASFKVDNEIPYAITLNFYNCIFQGETGLYINDTKEVTETSEQLNKDINLYNCQFKLLPGDAGDTTPQYYKGCALGVSTTSEDVNILAIGCIELGYEESENVYKPLTISGTFNKVYGSYGNNLTGLNY